MRFIVVVLLVLVLAANAESVRGDGATKYCVKRIEDGQEEFDITEDLSECLATAVYKDQMMTTGWNLLKVWTNATYPDEDTAYAAGFLEGALTEQRIWEFYWNYFSNFTMLDKTRRFLEESHEYLESEFTKNSSDPFYYQAHLLYRQMEGVRDGYASVASHPHNMTEDDFNYMFFYGDVADLNSILVGGLPENDRCSALIKVLPDFSDIYMAQNAWSKYHTMTRIYKVFEFAFKMSETSSKTVPSTTISFSSYPTFYYSFDDFYVNSNGLIVQETTIGSNNKSLNEFVVPKSAAVGIRSMIANRLATNGEEWSQLYDKDNNGCYNNEFMILDTSKFTPGEKILKNGLLWVVEQIPGKSIWKDMTETLRNQTYWPSYNSAAFKEIRDLSNVTIREKEDDYYTYDKNPRAKIFHRDHVNVKSEKDMRKLMRYNDFKNDEFSKCNCTPAYTASFAISMRGDLNLVNGSYPMPGWGLRNHGALDVKFTSYTMFKKGQLVQIISGPTNDQQPTFVWSTSPFKDTPDTWNFPWYEFDPATLSLKELSYQVPDRAKDKAKMNQTIFIVSMVVVGLSAVIIVAFFIRKYFVSKKSKKDTENPLLESSITSTKTAMN